MTQEDKELLLRDLCARLPYGVKVKTEIHDTAILEPFYLDQHEILHPIAYLRPMSSMTEEEIFEFIQISDSVLRVGERKSTCILSIEQIDWLNAHHFDFRNLIERGLAIKVTVENNPYK